MHRVLAAVPIVSLVGLLAAPAAAKWEQQQFVIMLGWPFEIECPDDEALARAMKDAGFNVVMWDMHKLDLCRRVGLQVNLYHGDADLGPDADLSPWPPEWQRTYYGLVSSVPRLTPELVEQVKHHPALWGYHVKDEPSRELFPRMAQERQTINAADPTRPTYINLVSGGGEYLRSFMEIVQPTYLSYDYYQWWWGTGSHFSQLEEHREAALTASVPLFCWVEVDANPGRERTPFEEAGGLAYYDDNLVKLRQSVYTNLTYGVTGILWFTGPMMFRHGTAELNEPGQEVVALNRELARLGPELVRLRSTEVFHTGELPGRTRALPEDWWVATGTPDLVLGFFTRKDGAAGEYLMVTNRSIEGGRWVTLQFRRPVAQLERFDRRTGQWDAVALGSREGRPAAQLILPAGDGVLLRVR